MKTDLDYKFRTEAYERLKHVLGRPPSPPMIDAVVELMKWAQTK